MKYLIDAAKADDDAAARILLGLLAEYLERGEVPPAALTAYFVPAFKKIVAGYKAEDALHTKGQGTNDQRNYYIARLVWWFHTRPVDPLPLSLEASTEHPVGAYHAAAKIYAVHNIFKPLSPESIKKIYQDLKDKIDLESSEPPMTEEESRQSEVDIQLKLAELAELLKNKGKD